MELICGGAAADERNAFAPIHGAAVRVLLDKGTIARFLGPLRDLTQGVVPRNVLPVGCARAPDLRLRQPSRVQHVLFERRALGAQRSAVGWMIGIAFDMDHLRRDVLCPITNRVDEDAASDRAIGTRRARFGGACNLQLFELRVSGLEVKPKDGSSDCAYRCCLEEVSAGLLHRNDLRVCPRVEGLSDLLVFEFSYT